MAAKNSAFERLQEILRELGYAPKTHATARDVVVPGSYLRCKYVFADLGSFLFFASDSYGGGPSSTYTGVYTPIELAENAECSIFRKEWFDRWLVSGKFKTGHEYIDRYLTIKSSGWNPSEWLEPETVNLFLKLSREIKPIKLIVQNDYMKLTSLKGKKVA
ncbi:MAG: hypothetical protein LUD68_08225, partial [Rikenellaceae bacterium]|nr:hypothetical protein [Rikenellaceae bacterium]